MTRQLALITGASSGIGLELAKCFAADEVDLIICAQDGGLAQAAQQLRALGVDVEPVQADLTSAVAVEQLHAAVGGRPLYAVALNAGVGQGRAFVDQQLADVLEVIDLNVRSTVHLAHLLLPEMVARNAGRLLITSSIASTMPGSYQAVYNASKSFLQSFAEALQSELADTDVTVTSLMPGPTDTDFFHRADMDDTKVAQGAKDDPAQVARQGYEALISDERRVVAASLRTKVMEAANKITPDRVKAAVHANMAEPQDGGPS
jgi:short-subunit dehydrogenase